MVQVALNGGSISVGAGVGGGPLQFPMNGAVPNFPHHHHHDGGHHMAMGNHGNM